MLCLANQQEKGVVSGGYTASPTYIRQQFQPEICLLEAKTAFRKGVPDTNPRDEKHGDDGLWDYPSRASTPVTVPNGLPA